MANAEAEAVEMKKELYVAAMKGNIGFLEGQNDEDLLRKTRQNRNVLHVATRYEQTEFVQALLEKFPNNYNLITDRETSDKNTPLHIAAEVGNSGIMSILYDYFKRVKCHEGEKSQPWKLKNSRGNTLVHVALLHDNLNVARDLLEKDPEYASILNESAEAPLHIAIKQHVDRFEVESTVAKIKDPISKGGAALPIKNEPGEDMSSMIELLLQKASCVASWPDTKGLTPLLRAASLGAPYNLQTIRLLVRYCPQSAEVCDAKGNSILHLLVNKIPSHQDVSNLVWLPEIFPLRNHQDHLGNTPLHIAVKNMDINMVRVVLESSPKLRINNSDGKSVISLLLQHNILERLRQRKMTKEESESAERADINFLRERMMNLGLNFVLSKKFDDKNLLHKLMHLKNESRIDHDNFVAFIEEILEIFPAVVCQTDRNGNTPVHILVQNNYNTKIYFVSENPNTTKINHFIEFSLELLERCNKCIIDEATKNKEDYELPWLVKNAAGNTPLHEAILAKNKHLALKLLEYGQTAAAEVNSFKETPLHLLARNNHENMYQFRREDIVNMVEANTEAAQRRDEDGLTPILRAFRADDLFTAALLCEESPPEAAAIDDADGNTFWHLLVRRPSTDFLNRLLSKEELRKVLKQGDGDGNTPLHLAMQDKRFDIVKEFFENLGHERDEHWLLDLLVTRNKVGKTPGDLIAEETCLPFEIEKHIKDKHEMVGFRSAWGIPTTQTKTYVNSMGIIAALLATITFTAAFSVPGGLIQDTGEDMGTPVMLEKAAFQVFMISDVIAMCLSMMVLVCLLKIMATNNTRDSVMILDLSISLLMLSFYATILTFMVGLFAAMFTAKPWIAIVTLALCCLLILLVFKFFFIKFLNSLNKLDRFVHWILRKILNSFPF